MELDAEEWAFAKALGLDLRQLRDDTLQVRCRLHRRGATAAGGLSPNRGCLAPLSAASPRAIVAVVVAFSFLWCLRGARVARAAAGCVALMPGRVCVCAGAAVRATVLRQRDADAHRSAASLAA
jgi:hypothetical protein